MLGNHLPAQWPHLLVLSLVGFMLDLPGRVPHTQICIFFGVSQRLFAICPNWGQPLPLAEAAVAQEALQAVAGPCQGNQVICIRSSDWSPRAPNGSVFQGGMLCCAAFPLSFLLHWGLSPAVFLSLLLHRSLSPAVLSVGGREHKAAAHSGCGLWPMSGKCPCLLVQLERLLPEAGEYWSKMMFPWSFVLRKPVWPGELKKKQGKTKTPMEE